MSRSSDLLGRARALLAHRLSAKSYEHCERVAAQAIALARRFGVDTDDAELAGLLHDYARDMDDTELLATAAELGVPITPFERENPYLIHARVGAALARRDLPGIGERVLSAVELHTVGGLPMSDLDKIVYLADMIEPARVYPGVDGLRAACADEALSECFRRGYARSLRYVMEKGKLVHPISSTVVAEIERETGQPLFDTLLHEHHDVTAADSVSAEAEDAPPRIEDDADSERRSGDETASAEDAQAEEPREAAASQHDASSDRRVRRVRRRRAGRAHQAHQAHGAADASGADTPAAGADRGTSGATTRGAARAGASKAGSIVRGTLTVLLAVALIAGALVGLVFGVNGLARWWALQHAGSAIPTSAAENNLLVIGVEDGVAVGFTALKAERANGRVLGIAIPDGAFVEVPGQGFERVGSSYVAGPEVSKDTVSNYLGVSFPRYVVVDGATYQSLLTSQDVSPLVDRALETDLTEKEKASFGAYFGKVTRKNVWIVPLPVKPVAVGDQQYYEPQRDQVADLLLQWWGVKASAQKSTPRVIVYNGVGTPGLAGQASQQLIRTGFRIVNSGNADNFDYATTRIYLYHGTEADARAVKQALGVGVITVQSAPQELTDMIVIIGADYRPPLDTGSEVPTEGVK